MDEYVAVYKAVAQLNGILTEEYDLPYDYPAFCIIGGSDTIRVDFMGAFIWSVDDDSREYNEKTDEYESYISFFRRMGIEVIEKLKVAQLGLQRLSIVIKV